MDFEETSFWKRSTALADACYRLTSVLPPSETYGLSSQIRRAACSVYANFAEGWSRESMRESAHFIAVSRGSLAELKAHLLFCVLRGWMRAEDIAASLAEIDELRRILSTIRIRILRKADRQR